MVVVCPEDESVVLGDGERWDDEWKWKAED